MTDTTKLSIGNSDSNDIVTKHKTVSQVHAHLRRMPDGRYELTDADSTNGTMVNNRRVKRKIIDEKDSILLGGLVVEAHRLITEVETHYLQNKVDFSAEYQVVIKQLQEYSKRKNRMTNGSLQTNIVRVTLSLIFVCILLFRPNLIPDPSTRYILIMLIGLVPVFMGIFAGSGEKKRTKLDLLKLEYEELVVCPKCTGSLLRYTPAYLINKKKCPNQKCDAIYNCSHT